MHSTRLQLSLRRGLEFVVADPVRTESSLVAAAAWLELIATSSVVTVHKTHELRCAVAVIVRRAERAGSDVPPRRKDEEVGEWVARGLGFGGEDAEDRR